MEPDLNMSWPAHGTTVKRFKRGDKVHVNYLTGGVDECYVGPGRFERMICSGEGYDHELAKGEVAFVTLGRIRGHAFPLTAISPR